MYNPEPYTITQKKGSVKSSRAHPRHVITQNTTFCKRFKVPEPEGDKKGAKIKDKGDDLDLFERDPEQMGEDGIYDGHQEDHWIGDEDEQVQGRDNIQEDNNVSENGQAPGGRPRRQRQVPRWHKQYEMG